MNYVIYCSVFTENRNEVTRANKPWETQINEVQVKKMKRGIDPSDKTLTFLLVWASA